MIVQMTPRGLLAIFFRHRTKFARVLLVCIAAAIGYCLLAKPQYESDARLLVKFGRDTSNRPSALSTSTISAQQTERKEVVNSNISMLTSRDLMLDVLRTLSIGQVYPSLASEPNPKILEDNALRRFAKNFNAIAENDTSIIDLSLLNPDPDMAAKALQAVIDKFVMIQANIYQSGQLGFLQQQMAQAKDQLEKSRAAVRAFKLTSGISSLEEERTLLLRQQSDAQQSLTQEISHQQEAEGRYARLEDAIKNLPDEIKLSDENDRFKAVDDARSHLNDLLNRQKELAINYRPDSTTMQSVQSEIQFARQQLAGMSKESAARIRSGANPVRQQIEINLLQAAGDQFSATAGRASYESELARISQRLRDLESMGVRLDALQLQQQVDEETFRNYMQEVEEARLTDDLNRERITSIAVVQRPTFPVRPAKPNVVLILALGVLVGLAGAIAIALIAEMIDEGFSTPDQIEAITGIPVLGTFALARVPRQRPFRAFTMIMAGVTVLAFAILIGAAALAADLLDPNYGRSLVVRDDANKVTEYLTPQDGEFVRRAVDGEPLGYAKSAGSALTFFDTEGHGMLTARRELLPPNFPINAIAVVRGPFGKAVGYIARY